jgi:hypothetical protein
METKKDHPEKSPVTHGKLQPQQEWTEERLRKYINIHDTNLFRLAQDINAALAAERRKAYSEGNTAAFESKYVRGLEQQLLQAQAAIAEHDRYAAEKCHYHVGKTVDLSALDKHDAEVRKPLADALKWALKVLKLGETPQAEQILADALAKVKEAK